MDIYLKRITKLIESCKDTFLITNDKNIYYFTGLWDSNGYLLITNKKAYLFVDFRYGEIAEKTVKSAEVIIFSDLYKEMNLLLSSTENCHLETGSVTLSQYKNFSEKLRCNILNDDILDKTIKDMRIIKDEEEIKLLKKAQDITEQALKNTLPIISEGVTERMVAVELEHKMKILGAEQVSFDLITITGKKTSLPHGVPGDDIIRNGDFFTMDIGATYKGYHSDMTRTFCIGEPTEEMKKVYSIVLKAHYMALNSVKPGMKCSDIDKIARDYIYSKGYEGCFGHSTGHGVGLDIHEFPVVSTKSDVTLKKGMVITIEPGIYLKDKFGVRIEDTVVVTEDGCKSFANISKDLTIL